jgi:hypothetical protein
MSGLNDRANIVSSAYDQKIKSSSPIAYVNGTKYGPFQRLYGLLITPNSNDWTITSVDESKVKESYSFLINGKKYGPYDRADNVDTTVQVANGHWSFVYAKAGKIYYNIDGLIYGPYQDYVNKVSVQEFDQLDYFMGMSYCSLKPAVEGSDEALFGNQEFESCYVNVKGKVFGPYKEWPIISSESYRDLPIYVSKNQVAIFYQKDKLIYLNYQGKDYQLGPVAKDSYQQYLDLVFDDKFLSFNLNGYFYVYGDVKKFGFAKEGLQAQYTNVDFEQLRISGKQICFAYGNYSNKQYYLASFDNKKDLAKINNLIFSDNTCDFAYKIDNKIKIVIAGKTKYEHEADDMMQLVVMNNGDWYSHFINKNKRYLVKNGKLSGPYNNLSFVYPNKYFKQNYRLNKDYQFKSDSNALAVIYDSPTNEDLQYVEIMSKKYGPFLKLKGDSNSMFCGTKDKWVFSYFEKGMEQLITNDTTIKGAVSRHIECYDGRTLALYSLKTEKANRFLINNQTYGPFYYNYNDLWSLSQAELTKGGVDSKMDFVVTKNYLMVLQNKMTNRIKDMDDKSISGGNSEKVIISLPLDKSYDLNKDQAYLKSPCGKLNQWSKTTN